MDAKHLKAVAADPTNSDEKRAMAESYLAGIECVYSTDALVWKNMTIAEAAEELNVPWTDVLKTIAEKWPYEQNPKT